MLEPFEHAELALEPIEGVRGDVAQCLDGDDLSGLPIERLVDDAEAARTEGSKDLEARQIGELEIGSHAAFYRSSLRLQQHLDRTTFVHRAIRVGDLIEG